MSGLSGFSICRQLKNDDRTKNIPVIFMSALAETEAKVQGLMLGAVDHFKIYNDTYGHHQGDLCLQQVAGAIAKVIKRSGDILARYGGEEFALILPNIDRLGAIQVAQTISTAIKQLALPHFNSPSSSIVSMSIGVATVIPNAKSQPYALVEAADQALYEAKDLGRDRIAVFERSPCLSY